MAVQLYLASCVSWRSDAPLWLSSLKAMVRLFPLFQVVKHQDILPCMYTSKGSILSSPDVIVLPLALGLFYRTMRRKTYEGDLIHYDLEEKKGHPAPWICHSPHKYSLKTPLNHTTQRSLALVQHTPVSIIGLNFCFKPSRSPDWILSFKKTRTRKFLYYFIDCFTGTHSYVLLKKFTLELFQGDWR